MILPLSQRMFCLGSKNDPTTPFSTTQGIFVDNEGFIDTTSG